MIKKVVLSKSIKVAVLKKQPLNFMELLTTNGFSDKNYGWWLNKVMESSPSEWVMFHDHDILLVNPNWYKIVCNNIENADNPGWLTCIANRIGNKHQLFPVKGNHDDIIKHREIALEIEKKEPLRDVTGVHPISGLVMVTSKTAWRKAGGFRPQGGYIGLDNNYHGRIKKAGYKVYIMTNLYVYHWYRGKWKY